jgi:hypothetical protein
MLFTRRSWSWLCVGLVALATGCASEIPKEVTKSPDKATTPDAAGGKATKRIIVLTNGNSP